MACEECAVEAVVDGKRSLVKIRLERTDDLGIDPSTWCSLRRCRACGTYWELVDQRWYRALSSDAARLQLPKVVRSASPAADHRAKAGREEGPRGWAFQVTEVSAGVYLARGVDVDGRSVETTGTDPDAVMEECRRSARVIAKDSRAT